MSRRPSISLSLNLLLRGPQAAYSHCAPHPETLTAASSRPTSLPLLSLTQEVIKSCSLHSSHGVISEVECLISGPTKFPFYRQERCGPAS